MNKLSSKHLLVLFLVLLLIVFLIRYVPGRKDTMRSTFFTEETENLKSIRILAHGDTSRAFLLLRDDDTWFVSSAAMYAEADPDMMLRILKDIKKLRPAALLSRSSEKWSEYGVDSSAFLIQLDFNTGVSFEILLGNLFFKNGRMAGHYVRIPGEKEVYSVDAYLEGSLKSQATDLRNKKVLNSPADQWEWMDYSFAEKEGRKTVLEKREGAWYKDTVLCDNFLIDSLLRDIEHLQELPFSEATDTEGLKPHITIRIRDHHQQITHLHFFRTSSVECGANTETRGSEADAREDAVCLLESSINRGNRFRVENTKMQRIRDLLFLLEE
jgi:hypothetical protein